jgi:hypothetical protein
MSHFSDDGGTGNSSLQTDGVFNSTPADNAAFLDEMNLMKVYRALVLVVALVGVSANGLVMIVFGLSSKQLKKEKFNILFLNQTALDMYSCAMLAVIQAFGLFKIYLIGSWGYWLCTLLLNEVWLWIGLNGSTANLVVIAVERYVKIVHPIWHKNPTGNLIQANC